MKKIFLLFNLSFILNINAQLNQTKTSNTQKDLKTSEKQGYQNFLKYDASSKQALKNQKHKHTPYETIKEVEETVIYLSPNKTTNTGCVNMGFDQYNFSGWAGEYGTTSPDTVGGGTPSFNPTGNSIVNTAGNNTSLVNTINYHTLMTKPALNPIYPICNGYDSIACKVVGIQKISQIPVVSPYSQDLVSVRLNGAVANWRASRLKYITTTSAVNQQISYSFATVLESDAHAPFDTPYFKVEIKNENTGLLLPGCNSYTINPQNAGPEDSLRYSAIKSTAVYRKWQLVSVDLSSLPLGTDVSVTFEVGSCSNGGHWGYAYVDAECGSNNLVSSNMCAGSSFASLVAPQGMLSYQWLNSSNMPIPGATNDTLIVNAPNIGDAYSVQMTAIGGCITTQTVAVNTSSVSINNITSVGFCAPGNSGMATVYPAGTTGAYSYTWTSINTGSVVGNSQTAVNLLPGNYSITVESGTCGHATGTISVPIAPVVLTTQTKNFCGNKTLLIANPLSSNIKWYNGLLLPVPNNNDTLVINNPNNNDQYTLVSTNPQGCIDSVRYTLVRNSTNYSYVTNINNSCLDSANGSAVINLYSNNSGPFNYVVYGPSGLVTTTITSLASMPLNALSIGTYTATVYEGACIHVKKFTINTLINSYTLTPSVLNSCNPSDTVRVNFNYASNIPQFCDLSTSGSCINPNQITIGTDTLTNTSNSYPAVYGNWYKNSRHQILFRSNELLSAGVLPGKISSISFYIASVVGTNVYTGLEIKMKCTTDTSLSSPNFDQSGLNYVFSSSSVNIVTGWNVYQFPLAYEWDGVSNLLIDVCNSSAYYTQNSLSRYSITPFASVRWFNSDGILACPISTGNSISPNNRFRPNIKFGNCPMNPQSNLYTISVSSNGTITHNFNNDSIKISPVGTPTANMIYTISVTNGQGGCVSSQSFSLINPTLYVVGTNSICEGTSAVFNASGATTYTWNNGTTTSSINVTPTATSVYTVTGTDVNNCSTTQTVEIIVDNTCQDVWPGDANSDGIADNTDVLELGLHYTQTGPARTTLSSSWQSFHANNWTGTISNGKNVNHSDCNGDGIINADDTLAIYNNYGLTHAFKQNNNQVVNPQLIIVPDQSAIVKGTWGSSSIYLGDVSNDITNVNGVAFTVDFDNTLIEPNSIWIEYINSFINTGDNLNFRKADFANGRIHSATTHTLSNNVNGNGKIAVLHYQIKSNLANDAVLSLALQQANQSDASGNISPLTSGSATVMAVANSVGIKDITGNEVITVHPNPSSGVLNIKSTTVLQKVELLTVTGQVVMSEEVIGNTNALNMSKLSNGIYILNVYKNNRVVARQRVVLNK